MTSTLVVSRSIHAAIFSNSELRRFIRIYFPRSYEDLLEYDYFLFDQPVLGHFENRHVEWLYQMLMDEGKGSLAFTQSQNEEVYGPWMNSKLPRAFPHDQERFLEGVNKGIEPYTLEINDDKSLPPVIRPYKELGIERVKPFGYTRALHEKEGSTVWARARDIQSFANMGFINCPLLLSWEYGDESSRIWATGDQFVSPMWGSWWGADGKQRFSLDIFVNIAWYSCRWELPQDPLVVHRLRNQFTEYKLRFSSLYSLLDFIEKFGASSRKLQDEIGEIESMRSKAEENYLSQKFEISSAEMSQIFNMIKRLESKAVEMKKSTLLWVYMVEWLTVTGIITMAGFLTWTLMVRRRLYRRVKTTRGR